MEIYERVELVPSILKACTKVSDIHNQEDLEGKKAAALRVTLTLVSRLIHSQHLGFITQICLSMQNPAVSGMFESLICQPKSVSSIAVHSISILNRVLACSENNHNVIINSSQIVPLLSQSVENMELLSKLVIFFALTLRLEIRDSRPKSLDKTILKKLDSLDMFFPDEVKFCRKFIILNE